MIGLYAGHGRMGKALQHALIGESFVVYDRADLSSFINQVMIVIDFSTIHATLDLILFLEQEKKNLPLVIGTTGFSDQEFNLIKEYSKKAPVFYAANFSLGVYIQKKVSEFIAKNLDFDVEIFEAHHHLKKDSPSGTALSLGRAIANARCQVFEDQATFTRTSQREKGQIGFACHRGGGIIGEHTVRFYGEFEDISVMHRGYSRDIYALGALKAAHWIKNQPPGLYGMDDLFVF